MRRKEDPLDNIFAVIQGHTGPPLALLVVTAATVGSALTTLALRRWGPEASPSSSSPRDEDDELEDLDATSVDSAPGRAMTSTMKRAEVEEWDRYFAMDAATPSDREDRGRPHHDDSDLFDSDIDEETLWRGASEAMKTLSGDLGTSGFSNDRSSYDSPPVSEGARRRMDGRRRRSEDGIGQASASPRVETIEEDEREGGASWPTKEPTVTATVTQKRPDVVFAAQREESPRTVLGDVTNARRR